MNIIEEFVAHDVMLKSKQNGKAMQRNITLIFVLRKRGSTVIAQIFIRDLISYISYFWRKVRNLVAYENHTRIKVYLTSPSLYENF